MRDKTLIIAEAGVNHNGDPALARELIRAGAAAGIEVVKFQTAIPAAITSRHAAKAKYQIQNTKNAEETQLEMLEKLRLPDSAWAGLVGLAGELGVEFLSTAFDEGSVDFLEGFGLKRLKIPSGELTNAPLLKKIAQVAADREVLLSTGMATLAEVGAAVDLLTRQGVKRDQLVLMHCTSEYPAPVASLNLRAITTLREAFNLRVGYSDHSLGYEAALIALALGAQVIEKHFTLDKTLPGPDHAASLSPEELKIFVEKIRECELALGSGEKIPAPCEEETRLLVRKSLIAARPIRAGEVFDESNLTTKRPGTGVSAWRYFDFLGRVAGRDYAEDELIDEEGADG